jgi:hypothetical protein
VQHSNREIVSGAFDGGTHFGSGFLYSRMTLDNFAPI